MTLHISIWTIPTAITVASLFWAIYIVEGEDGYLSGLDNLLALIPALGISCLSWIAFAIFK